MTNKPTYEELVGMLQRLTDSFAGNSEVKLGVAMYDANVMLDEAKQALMEESQRRPSPGM